MGIYEKAVLYHFFHALGLLVVSCFTADRSDRHRRPQTASVRCFLAVSFFFQEACMFWQLVEYGHWAPLHRWEVWRFSQHGRCWHSA